MPKELRNTKLMGLFLMIIALAAVLCAAVATGYAQGGAMAELKEIRLPEPKTKGAMSLEEAIAKRRSVRSYGQKELGRDAISQLLWAAQGVTAEKSGFTYRAAPSAGAVYPMEIYLLSKDGLFHYLPEKHALETLGARDLRPELSEACFGQRSVKDAAIDIVICGAAERLMKKYKDRAMRYLYMEAGHIAQNIHLQAVALGLGSLPVGAFGDKEAAKVLGLPKGLEVVYIVPVG